MKTSTLQKLVEARIKKTRSLIITKGKEYARNDKDRLRNFKRGADLLKCSTARACLGPWSKHIVSILNMVDDLDIGLHHSLETWDEKIGDAIVYLILLEAIIAEGDGHGT